ncbi:MAG: hypothetical protein AAGG00_06090 [Cyanobacteria bacterium P01_H01_bin.150]
MKRCILKTQVNFHTVQETLLISSVGKTQELEQFKSIVLMTKSVEIFKTLNCYFEKFLNASYCLLAICKQGEIINSWVSNLTYRYLQGQVVKMYADLNINFERLGKPKVTFIGLFLTNLIQLRKHFFTEKIVSLSPVPW